MNGFIQVGVTAMRDPASGDFLESVPLYIRADDMEKAAVPIFDRAMAACLAEKFKEYKKAERREKGKKIAG